MKNFFKNKRGELNFIKISAFTVVILFILSILFVVFFVGENNQTTAIQSESKDNLSIDTGIPAQHQNVRLEKDKEVTYVTQNEVEKIVSRAVTSQMEKAYMEIDKNQKENLDTINQFQNDYDSKIEQEINSIKANISEEMLNNEQKIDLDSLEKKIVEKLNDENESLRERISNLEKKIAELENKNINTASDNESSDKTIELPENTYAEQSEPEPEVRVEEKIVYRDRFIEKEEEPEPEPSKTYIPFTVEGIFTGQNNVAVINDNGRTSNIKEGSNYKQFKFKKINDSSVLVAVDGREITVNLKDGGREF